jgi:hypothetical protein
MSDQDTKPPLSDPWAGVTLVAFNLNGRHLSDAAHKRLGQCVRNAIRPHSSAPVFVLEEGSAVELCGEGTQVVASIGPEVLGLIVLTEADRQAIELARSELLAENLTSVEAFDVAALFAILDRGLPPREQP